MDVTKPASGREERLKRVEQIRNMCTASSEAKKRDLECWDMYNEFQDEKKYDYLRKIGDYELPARIRNVGKQRPKINNLVSQNARRPFTYSVTAIDKNSLKRKHESIVSDWLDRINERIYDRYYQVSVQVQQIDQQIQKLQEMAQQQGVDDATKQQLQQVLPQYLMQLQMIKAQASRQQEFTETEIEEIKKYYKYDFKDFREQYAQKLSAKLIERLEITNKSIQNFISHLVTGKQYYYVDYISGEANARFECLNDIKVYFPQVEGVKWTQNGDWVAIEENWPMSRVRAEYWDLLTDDQRKSLEQSQGYAATDKVAITPDHGAVFHDGLYSGTKENDPTNSVKVMRVWWKQDRNIKVKKSPNPYTGDYFRHFVDPAKQVITSNDWMFRNGKYVNRNDKTLELNKEDVEFVNTAKKEYVATYPVRDRYRGVVLNDTIYVDLGVDPVQPRSMDSYYDVLLPVVGKTYSTVSERPYSLMWSTKDLQELYKIVHYHRELLLAISGTRGSVIDVSQKPKDMGMREWEYHKKLGRLYIQTTDKFSRKINNSFNQWQSYDDTASNSIQYLDLILDSIDNEISDAMGIPRQRMGVTVSTDQVGTNQMALNQSLLTTEILYYNHDLILSKALGQLINLQTRFCMTEDQMLEVTDMKLGKELVNIPGGLLSDIDWEILITNNIRDEQRMNELKQMMIQQNAKGLLPFENMLSLWTEDSLTKLIKDFEYFSKKSAEIQQLAASQNKEDAIEVERAKAEFQNQYNAVMEQNRVQIEGAKLELEREKLRLEQQKLLSSNQLAEAKLQQDRDIAASQIEADTNVELAYLVNQDKHETVNEQLQALQLQLDGMINSAYLNLDNRTEHHTHQQAMQKLRIEDKKAKSKVQTSIRR